MKENMKKKEKSIIRNKHAQITVFVIIAIIVVGVIAAIFIFLRGSNETGIPNLKKDPSGNVKITIQRCAEEATKEAEKILIPHGGMLNPSRQVAFNGTNVSFFCYTAETEELCSNLHPLLNQDISREIENYVEPKLQKCLDDKKNELKNYNYQDGPLDFSVEIGLNQIQLNIKKKISFVVGDNSVILENFDTKVSSPLYDFIKISTQIVNQEVSCNCDEESCNARIVELIQQNRNYDISKVLYNDDGIEIYRITEVESGKKFNFALRNCVRLP